MFVYTHRRFTFHFFRSSSTLTCLMCVFVSLSLVNAAYILFLTVKLKKEKKRKKRTEDCLMPTSGIDVAICAYVCPFFSCLIAMAGKGMHLYWCLSEKHVKRNEQVQ